MTVRCRDERGVGVVITLGLVGVLTTLALVCAAAVALVVTHRKAQSAADLAALAGATDLRAGRDGCAGAAQVAEANGAVLRACSVAGQEVEVTVVVAAPGVLGSRELRARARAGPSETGSVTADRVLKRHDI